MAIFNHSFPKEERLTSKVAIDQLFNNGNSLNVKPFKIRWLRDLERSTVNVKVLISVPKRIFKRAVDRNKLKRLFREAYRLNKHLLNNKLDNKKVNVMFVYSSPKIISFSEMESYVVDAMNELVKKIDG